MDVNDYLDDEPPVRRSAPRRATVAQQPPQQPVRQQANHHEYVSREIVHDRRRVNDVARQARAEFEDDEFLVDDRPQAPAKQKRGLFGLGKPKTKPQDTHPLLHPTQPKRDIFQVVSMFALAVGVLGLSAWQAWTVTSINAGALSIKWVHVSQAAIALQLLILFFVVDLRKQ